MVGNTSEPLDLTEELRLRRWARENYVPPAERDSSWHPVILDEMVRRDFEGNVGVEAEVPSEDEDIADDSTITIDVEKSWGELFVPIAELHCLHGAARIATSARLQPGGRCRVGDADRNCGGLVRVSGLSRFQRRLLAGLRSSGRCDLVVVICVERRSVCLPNATAFPRRSAPRRAFAWGRGAGSVLGSLPVRYSA